MSVVVSDTLRACGGEAERLLDATNSRVAAFTAGYARSLGQTVNRTPEDPDDPCDAHGSVLGEKNEDVQYALVSGLRIVASA